MKFFDLQSSALAASLLIACLNLAPGQTSSTSTAPGSSSSGSQENMAHASESKQAETAGKVYRDWLNQDVVWIITKEERQAFEKLTTNADRDRFIDQFWFRRNPKPGSGKNLFKEEHYRRIAYANMHFAGHAPGWKSDRGHIYIVHGKPDSVDSHPEGHPTPLVREEGGAASNYPYEIWRYRHLDGIGDNIELEFVDRCKCGEYELALGPGPVLIKPSN